MELRTDVAPLTLASQMGGFKSEYKIPPKKDGRRGLFEPRKRIKEKKIE